MRSTAERKRRYEADSPKVTSHGVGHGVAGGQQVQHGRALQLLLRQQRDQEALHLQRGRQLLRDLAHDVRLGARARARRPCGSASRDSRMRSTVSRGAGMKLRVVTFGQVLDELLLRRPASTRSPAGALRHHAQEGEARADRAVEGQRLVLGQHEVLDELARRRASPRCGACPEQTPVELLGRHAPWPRRPGRCAPRAARSVRLQRGHRVLQLHRLRRRSPAASGTSIVRFTVS